MRRFTHQEFINKLALINPNLEVLGEYINARTKIKCRCKIDDYIWDVVPSSLLKGLGCPKCARNYRKTHDDFIKEMSNINPNIRITSLYINDRTKVKCECLIDGHIWEATPRSLLNRKGCPKCSNHIRKTHEDFLYELSNINSDIEILSKYEHYERNVLCRCKICGHSWNATPHNLLHGTGCPVCRTSKGEKRIIKYLRINDIPFEWQKAFDGLLGVGGKNLSYDFYLPDHNLLIEYQGNFHDGTITGSYKKDFDFERQIEHDVRKKNYALKNGYNFLEIWYKDYSNIESKLNEFLNVT